MAEVLMGFGHEPIWGVRGSPIDINYSMSKTFTPISKNEMIIILVAYIGIGGPIFHSPKHRCEHGAYMHVGKPSPKLLEEFF